MITEESRMKILRKAMIEKTITHVANMYGLESDVIILNDDTVIGAFGSAGQGWFSIIEPELHGWKIEELKTQGDEHEL